MGVLSIAETKLDSSFPNAWFLLPGFYEPLRLNMNYQGGRLLVYIKASLQSKILTKFKLPRNIQIIPFEINLRKEKCLFISIYKPPSQSNQYFLDILGDLGDFYSQDYDSKVILRYFNSEPPNSSIASFMNNQNLFNMMKSNICFKLSDHHHLIYNNI